MAPQSLSRAGDGSPCGDDVVDKEDMLGYRRSGWDEGILQVSMACWLIEFCLSWGVPNSFEAMAHRERELTG